MITLLTPVGKGCPNLPQDVKAIHKALMDAAKIPCYPCNGIIDDHIQKGILSVQQHFMQSPDGVIDVNGTTHKYLNTWKEKPVGAGVVFIGRLKEAWQLVNPLLPDGSYCSSAYRTADDQRRILHKFYREKYKNDIIAKYGKAKYDSVAADLLKNESQVLDMVRGVGQHIAAPGRSMHQQGKAIDIGGPNDSLQVKIVQVVAKANPTLLSGKVIKERNGCVHFEIH
jgi:hypothetical protein